MIIRLADPQDIEPALEVCLVNDHPGPLSPADRASILDHWYMLQANEPQGFWIAQDEATRQIVGIASAIRRDPQWILTNFYVLPAFHGQGIGKQLLARAFAIHQPGDRLLVHASTHPSAQSQYIQLGMYPLPYSIMFEGRPEQVVLPSELAVEESPPEPILPAVEVLDRQALGFTRGEYHRWWAKKGVYFLAKQADQIAGYFRVSPEGFIGPLVVSDPRYMIAVLDWAIARQQELSPDPHLVFVPGANQAAIVHLFARGYRFKEANLLLSSNAMPGLARVIFHDTDIL